MFYIVDVFAIEKYTGNQLAVFTDTHNISDAEMQKLAQEMNYSETTFITSQFPVNNGYNVRIFTPKSEIPFAGHPTLGTAFIIQQKIINQVVEKVILNLPIGQIPITFIYDENNQVDVLWMKQNQPEFYQSFTREQISPLLNLAVEDIDDKFPIQEVSTGLPFLIVPLKNQISLQKAKVNQELFFQFIQNITAKAILIFCPECKNQENDLSVRVFVDYYGIPEDPATGSANGCLAGYLLQYNYFNSDAINIKVEQGYEINRPSLLLLQGRKNYQKIEVNVGGKVIAIAQGQLTINN